MVAFSFIKSVYQESFLQLRDSFPRKTYLSYSLLTFQLLQIQGIFLKAEVVPQTEIKGIMAGIIWLLESSKIYPLFQSSTTLNQIYFVQACFFFALIYIVLIITYLSLKFRTCKIKKSDQICGLFQFDTIQQPQNIAFTWETRIIGLTIQLISFFLQTNKYIFHWTAVNSCLQNIYWGLVENQSILQCIYICYKEWANLTGVLASFFVLLIFMLIDFFQIFHTFDFKFKNIDTLGEKESNLNILLHLYTYISIFIMIFTQQSYPRLMLFLGLLFTLFSLLLSTLQFIFRMQLLNNLMSIILGQFIFIYAGTLLYCYDQFKIQHINNLVIITSPIVYHLWSLILGWQSRQHILLERDNDKNIEEKLRRMYNFIKITYDHDWTVFKKPILRQPPSLDLFSLAVNHLRNCKGYQLADSRLKTQQIKKCFCREYFPLSEEQTSKYWKKDVLGDLETKIFAFQSEKQFKCFLNDLIKQQFERHLTQKSALQTNSYFSYIYFLIQVIKRPTKAFYEAMNLKLLLTKSISMKKSMIIEQLIKDAKQNFDLMIEKKDLKNQKYNFKQVFEFDRNLELVKLNFQIILLNYKKWYNSLLSEKLSLEQILQKGSIINKQIACFDSQLQSLYHLNPLSTEIDTIIYLFYRYLNFNIKRPKSTKRDSKFANNFIQSIHAKVFQRDSCLVYLSLMNQRGMIKNYTKSFKQIVGGNDLDIKNQNIKQFMPDSISVHHDLYLDNFIELGRMNIVMAEQRFLLVKCATQFIIPVFAKVRLENYSTDDFGSSALITKINQSYYYAVISKTGLLEEISQNFYEDIIYKGLETPLYQLKNLNFTRLMPCILKDLQILESRQIDNDIDFEFSGEKSGQISYDVVQEGHIIIPKLHNQINSLFQDSKLNQSINLHDYLTSQQKYNQLYFQNIQNVHAFFIKYKIRLMKTINSIINILEIQHIKVLKSEALEKALQSVQSLCNLEYATQKKMSSAQINVGQFEQNTFACFSKVELDFQQVKQLYNQQEEYNLEENFIIEEMNMANQKQRNIGDVYLQKNNQTTMLNSADSQMFGKYKDLQLKSLLETNISNVVKNKNESLQIQVPQRLEIEHSIDAFDNTLHSNSSESQEQKVEKNFQQDGASSIGSSQQYNDYISKRRVLREVLYSDHQYDNNLSKKLLLIINMILLTTLYLINFIFFTISQQDLQLIEQNKHVPNQIMNTFNSYIITSSVLSWNTYDTQWYQSFQNYSAESYINYTEIIFNQQNAIIHQSLFDEQQQAHFSDQSSIELNQMFLYRFIGQQMFDSLTDDTEIHKFFILNYEIIVNNMLLKLNESVIDNVEFEINQIESQQIFVLMFSEITLILIVAILLPVLLMINNKKNTILQFFTTIASVDLQQQHETYSLLTDRLEETKFTSTETNQFEIESLHIRKFAKKLKTMTNSKQIKQSQSQSKLRTIVGSSTTPMIFTNIILGITLFSILSSYFVSSFLIKLDFLKTYKQQNNEEYIFSCISGEFLRINSIQNLLLNSIVQANYSLITEKAVLQLLNDQTNSTYSILNYCSFQLSDLLPNFDSQKYEIVASNICAVFSSPLIDNLKYKNQLDYFNYQTCESFGSLQKGIQIVLNDFINQIKEFYSILSYHIENQEGFKTIPEELILLIDQELQQIYFYTWFALQLMLDSDDAGIQNSLNNTLKNQIILFTFCAIFIAIFSIVIERYIKNLISNYINQSKLLLTLIPFEILQSNAYVMNYVVQESKKLNA